ncbi:protein kinase domain-containing protein [Alkalinema pantanalense CENA528]|uniref:protein kinase domain-containing protein n=1 Tax=Alkalinema pantanalense TaxID=1620705 RepID=UPI003D6F0BE4
MIYCLNPDCKQPLNPDGVEHCESCGKKLVPLLRARYRVLRTLGQGGFGKTFLAVDEDRLKAKCVIKQFSPQLKGTKALEKAIQLFEQEAMRLYELGEHPHIPALLAYFEQDSRLYLVQQFIEGPTLAQELAKTGCFGEQKIREVLAGLLPILKFVHDRNVIHRDITPANIIRRKLDHRLVLIDFGVAKLLQESGTSIQPGTKIGTEGYAPIEQLRSGCAYPASDIYSLGATCLYLMTQTKPEELYDPLRGRWLWRESLEQRGVTFTEGIGRILDRMLKDLVGERYQSAAEVMQDLRVALSQPLINSEKRSSTSQSSSNVTQLPLSQQASSGQPTSGDLLSDSISDLPTTGFRVHPLTGSPSQPGTTGVSGTPPSFQRISSGPPLSNLPSNSPSIPPSRPSGVPKSPQSLPERFSNAQAASGPRATGGDSDSLCINVLKGHSSWILALAASPNGQVLVSAGLDNRIIVWDLVSGNQMMVLEGHHKPVNGLAFTPDGKTIVSCSDDTTIKLWDTSSGRLLRVLKGHIRDVTSIAVSPNGQFIASGSEDRTVCIWRLSTGELLRSFPGVAAMVKSVCISANGQFIASGGLDNQIKVWNLNAGTLVQTLTGHVNSVISVTMSENGRFLASGSKDRSIKIWNTQTGELIRSLQGNMDTVNAVAMSPDGRFLISGSSDKSVRVWRLSTGDPVVTLMDHTSPVNAIAISPNQRWFASAGSDSTVRIWSMKF